MSTRLSSSLIILIKIFIIGLLIHFLAHTLVTYERGRDNSLIHIVRFWKEIVLVIIAGVICRAGYQKYTSLTIIYKQLFQRLQQGWSRPPCISLSQAGYQSRVNRRSVWIVVGIFLYILVSSFLALFVVGSSPLALIASYKYNLIPYLILIIGMLGGTLLDQKTVSGLVHRSNKIMKGVLIGAILRYGIISFKPDLLNHIGYDTRYCEGSLTQAPPAVYRTELCFGIQRNQFVFERPTSFGFWLVVFWPLFFVTVLWRRRLTDTLHWWLLAGVILISTFSRAAWGAGLIEVLLLLGVFWRHRAMNFFLYAGIPLLAGISFLSITYHDQIIDRYYSNIGHINESIKALEKIGQHPRVGRGPGIAGPASHQLGSLGITGYNPENQYLQIIIEHGIIGGVWRIVVYICLIVIGFLPFIWLSINRHSLFSRKNRRQLYEPSLWLFGYSCGMLGLAICGLVLHSRGDKMITYPLMMMMGIIMGQIQKNKL